MTESAEGNVGEVASAAHGLVPKTVFIVGYTGETGKSLVRYIDKNKTFAKVKLIGRRQVQLDVENPELFEQVVVDFDKLETYVDALKGTTAGFCALGTTRAKSGYEGFIRVDHDYVVKIGEMAKASGCHHFSLVSSSGADKNSSLLYLRTKGQVEEALKVFHFDRLSVFRPKVILADRDNFRFAESLAVFFLKPIKYLFPTAMTVPVDYIAKAMVSNSLATSEQAIEVFDNRAIHMLGGKSEP